jgi:hypothetical protein
VNWYGDARAAVYDAIKAVLPGRVYAYPPGNGAQRSVAPAVYLEAISQASARFSGNARLWTVTLPVRIVVDGADHSAVAMLDELRSAVYDAVTATAGCVADDDSYEPVDVDGAATLPGARFNVAVAVHAISFCPPIPESAVFPPELVGVP